MTLLNLIMFCKAIAFSFPDAPIHTFFYSSSTKNLPADDFELSDPFDEIALVVDDRDLLL